jgi:hypothetical protein
LEQVQVKEQVQDSSLDSLPLLTSHPFPLLDLDLDLLLLQKENEGRKIELILPVKDR